MTTISVGHRVIITSDEYQTFGVNKGTTGNVFDLEIDGISKNIMYGVDVGFGHTGKSSPIIYVKRDEIEFMDDESPNDDPLLAVMNNISKTLEIMNKRLDNIEQMMGICEEEG
jgi:hypothetical protein